MFCPTCLEEPPHEDGTTVICLTCGDRLIPQQPPSRHDNNHAESSSSSQSRRRQQQQQQQQQQPADEHHYGSEALMTAMAVLEHELRLSGTSANPSLMSRTELSTMTPAATQATTTATATTTYHNYRPASQKVLDNLKREVLTANSHELLETQVELYDPCAIHEFSEMNNSLRHQRMTTIDAIPGEFTHTTLLLPQRQDNDYNHHYHNMPSLSTSTTNNKTKKDGVSDKYNNQQYPHSVTAALVLCTPSTTKGGQLSSQTLSEISILRKHNIPFIAYVTRGDNVTFVQKALVCQRAGMVVAADDPSPHTSSSSSSSSSSSIPVSSHCMGVIVGNVTTGSGNDEVWPYIMQDPKKEAEVFGLTVPVVMIRQQDGKRLVRWATSTIPTTTPTSTKHKSIKEQEESINESGEATSTTTTTATTTTITTTSSSATAAAEHHSNPPQNNDSSNYYYYYCTPCRITFRNKDSQSNICPVCADSYDIGNIIVRLPNCKHVFHETCALLWLTKHNTCPYCRSELATEDEEYEEERRRIRRRNTTMNNSNTTMMTTTTTMDNEESSNFYG